MQFVSPGQQCFLFVCSLHFGKTCFINQFKQIKSIVFVSVLFMLMSQLADNSYTKASCNRKSLAPPMTTPMPPRSRLFSERSIKLYLSFISLIKTKVSLEILRMQYYYIGTEV